MSDCESFMFVVVRDQSSKTAQPILRSD